MEGLGASWSVVLADSGSQARLGRRPGRLVGDFGGLDGPNLGPKMASSWGLDRTKIDANIARIFDAFENRNLDGTKNCVWDGKMMVFGRHLGWFVDNSFHS